MQKDEPTHPRCPSSHGRTSNTMQAAPDRLAAMDAWIEDDGARFDRSEAVQMLVDHAFGRTVASRGVRTLPPLLRPLDDVDPPA